MPYTLGTMHSGLSGAGTIALASPLGLKIIVSSIPAWAGHDGLTPPRYFRLGSLLPGNVDGWHSRVLLEHAAQLVLPLAPDSTTMRHQLVTGATMSIQELLAVAPANSEKQPWDRTGLAWMRSVYAEPSGNVGSVTAWTYTVPAGKKLWVSAASVWTYRRVAATSVGQTVAEVQIDSVRACVVVQNDNRLQEKIGDTMQGGVIVLEAGKVIAGAYQTSHVGGTVGVHVAAEGFVFDA